MQLRPDLGTGAEREEAHGLAAVAQGEHEQPRAAVRPARIPDHRPSAVVDLGLFPWRSDNDRMRVGRRVATKFADEPPHARVARGEAVAIDEVLPDRHGVATEPEPLLDQIPIRLARTGLGRAPGPGRPSAGRGVGGHRFGRICWRVAPPARRPHSQAGGAQILANRLAPDARRRFDPAQRPAQPSQRYDLLSLLVAQDVGHAGGGTIRSPAASTSWASLLMAGFQVSIYGRFWVSTEE